MWFKTNPNETFYPGGKKHWTDVIKNSGSGDLLIWKQPEEDFNTTSTLIVMPGEAAIFVHLGKIENVFTESGTYKLCTENYPFISRLTNSFSGGVSTFNCVVYFVRTTYTKELLWGTASPIQVRDPVHKVFCNLKARGAYSIQVCDPSKFLTILVGNNVQALQPEELEKYFGSQMMMYIKAYITEFIINSNVEVLGICSHLVEISIILSPFISKIVETFGLRLINFNIEAMDIPENDAHRKQLEESFALSAEMNVLGEKWARSKSAEILEYLSQNPGAGGIASAGAGMGMGMAAAPVFANLAQEMFGNLNVSQEGREPSQQEEPKKKYSLKTEKPQSSDDEFADSIKKLKTMLNMGAISQEQYNAKIQEILNRL